MSGFWNKLRGELIDIVQFLDDSNDTIVYRFERHSNEIKYGARLVVREGQSAVFVNEGQVADVFPPGTYTLETRNLPVLATLRGWKHGFESPFKAEVYFVSTRLFTDLKWGTMNPVMVRDPEFGPVRLRAFGTYTMRVKDPAAFLRTIVGTDGRFTTEEIVNQLRNLIVGEFADIVGQAKIPMLDLAGNYRELAGFIATKMREDLDRFGVDLPNLVVENISLPAEVEAALDKRSSMGVLGDLNTYTKYQTAEAIRDAANNTGAAGGFIGVGMGSAIGGGLAGAMGQAMAGNAEAGGAGGPPPIPGASSASPFFLAVDGKQHGPFEPALLLSKARSGELSGETLVWRQGMAQWTAARDVPEIAAALSAASPPPIPTPPPVPPRG